MPTKSYYIQIVGDGWEGDQFFTITQWASNAQLPRSADCFPAYTSTNCWWQEHSACKQPAECRFMESNPQSPDHWPNAIPIKCWIDM